MPTGFRGTAGRHEQFEILIIAVDDQRHVLPASTASVTAVVGVGPGLARAGTVMAWDPENGTLIAANLVGQTPWTIRE